MQLTLWAEMISLWVGMGGMFSDLSCKKTTFLHSCPMKSDLTRRPTRPLSGRVVEGNWFSDTYTPPGQIAL